jgi:hypothetical protein
MQKSSGALILLCSVKEARVPRSHLRSPLYEAFSGLGRELIMVVGPGSRGPRRNKSAAFGGRADPDQLRLAGVLLDP